MQLEQQVVSLELAKKLKELGVKQESIFVWYTNGSDAYLLYLGEDGMRPMESKTYSAYTASELGEMLPANIEHNDFPHSLHITKLHGGSWSARYLYWGFGQEGVSVAPGWDVDENLADAMAKMLIYLLENKLV